MNSKLYFVILFPVGMILLILLARYFRLYDFDGTPIQKRNAYSIAIATFFLAVSSLMIDIRTFANLQTLILTGLLFPGLAALSILWTKGKLRGNEIIYTTKSTRTHSVLVFLSVLVTMCFLFLMQFKFGLSLKQYTWIVQGVLLAFFLGTIFNFFYVMNLEKKVGRQIIERKISMATSEP